jgi:hypothetical protein
MTKGYIMDFWQFEVSNGHANYLYYFFVIFYVYGHKNYLGGKPIMLQGLKLWLKRDAPKKIKNLK